MPMRITLPSSGITLFLHPRISFPLATAKDCIMTIKKSELDARIRELTALIDEETDPDRRRQFQKEQSDLIIKSRSIR